jgi:hypothetical protein
MNRIDWPKETYVNVQTNRVSNENLEKKNVFTFTLFDQVILHFHEHFRQAHNVLINLEIRIDSLTIIAGFYARVSQLDIVVDVGLANVPLAR